MGALMRHMALGGVVGFALAIAVGLFWWLGSLLFGAAVADQLHAFVPLIALGIVAGSGAAAVITFLGRTRSGKTESPTPPPKNPAKASRRRHPLDRSACVARLSANLRWVRLSKALARLLGATRERFIDQPILRLVHPEDIPALDQAFTQARQTNKIQFALCRLHVRDPKRDDVELKTKGDDTALLPVWNPASMRYARVEVWAKLDKAGKVVRYDCRFTDLTPHIAPRERSLRTARRHLTSTKKRWAALNQDLTRLKLSYRELYQHAPVMYFSLDSQGKFVTFNETLVETVGYGRTELQGKSYSTLLAPAKLQSYVSIAASLPLEEGERETQWCKKDGTVIDVWLHSSPVYDEEGRFARCRSAALDLTEKNRLSHELRARGDELEHMNQQLRVINSELEAFTHVVSHDLKEPLRTLQAYSHILAEEHGSQLGPDGFQYVNHLIRASKRLGQLIDELLNLSQAGRATRAPQSFNLLEVVATVRQDLVDLIQRKQALLTTASAMPDVIGDPVRITQLLANLVANGLKYNRNSAPEVTISAAPCPDDPSKVTISVHDNGIGIDPAFHEQIFGIFRRLHQADEFEGTGAGLAICKKIVEGHGGQIWVESDLGQGATFHFTLPQAPLPSESASPNGAMHRSAEEKPAQRVTEFRPAQTTAGRVVVVDDQPDVGLIITKLGKRDGLAVTWFPTAEEAWEHLQRDRADLLLLDVNLPGMNGVELCQRLRTLAHLKETPIAMFTPEQDASKLQQMRDAGADFFLTKDLLCEPSAWQDRILELLNQTRQPLTH